MEPNFYGSFRMGLVSLPPHIPIPEVQDEEGIAEPRNIEESSASLLNARRIAQENAVMATSSRINILPSFMSTTEQQPFLHHFEGVSKNEETTRKSSQNDDATNYPHPNLSLPHPSLTLDFRMAVTLNPKISVGPTPFGHRNWISFTGGTWSGCWGSGIVLPGGQDSQLVQPNGTAHLETNYILQTYDNPPAYIVIRTKGWRTGPPEILAMLADPNQADKVDPSSYKFRLFIEMETGDERYHDQVNCGMWVGSGMRKGAEVIYDAYRIS